MRPDRRDFLRYLSAGALAMAVSEVSSAAREPALEIRWRPFAWRDAYNRWSVDSLIMSNDERMFALVMTRPMSAAGEFVADVAPNILDARGEIWILDAELRRPKRMEVSQERGVWSPQFSPDGRLLAALTLVDSGKIGFVVWDLARGSHRIFSECNVELFLSAFRTARTAYAGPSDRIDIQRQYVWCDSRSLLYVDHGPARQQDALASLNRSAAMQSLREGAAEGRLAVRVWDGNSPTCGTGGRLVRLACDTGKREVLCEADIRGVSLSPDRRAVAVVAATGQLSPAPDRPVDWPVEPLAYNYDPMVTLGLSLIDLANPKRSLEVEGVTGVGNVAPSRLPLWSDDSERIAIPVRGTYSNAPSTGDDAVWEVSARTGATRRWAASSALDGELLTALLATDGLESARILAERPQKVPSDDYIVAGGILGGAWRCPNRQVLYWCAPNLTIIRPDGQVEVAGQYSLVQAPSTRNGIAKSVTTAANGQTYIVTLSADKYSVEPLGRHDISTPGTNWSILCVRFEDSAAVYEHASDDGTFLVLARPGKLPHISPLQFNTYFREVLKPARRLLTRSFPDGTKRNALFMLPVGHKSGQRHPVVVWAYPDTTPTLDDYFTQLNDDNSVIRPIQYLLTKGFAFLQVPFPIGEKSGKSNANPMQSAVDAVLPWLEVLDQQRDVALGDYGFFGHSNAGYVALALESLTHRFKAIAAWSTFPEIGFDVLHNWPGYVPLNCAGNVIQSHRQFFEDPQEPYAPKPTPPWINPAAYIRNDPLFNLGSASTPLLLVQGEWDVSGPEMEEVYSILRGRGVPVELAYYWGEGHVFHSPGNILNSWLRTEAFFKKHLRASARAAGGA